MDYTKLEKCIDDRLLDFSLIWDTPITQIKSSWVYRYNSLIKKFPNDAEKHKSRFMVEAYQGLRDYYTKKDRIQRYLR